MPIDVPSEAAGLSAAVAALTAAIGTAVQHWAGASKRADRIAADQLVAHELRALTDRVGALDLAGVRAEADRTMLREALARLERDLTTLRDRMERQGVAVEAEMRPLREGVQTIQALLSRGSGA